MTTIHTAGVPGWSLDGPRRCAARAPGAIRLDVVQAFLAVAEDLHFTRAASRLYLSQSGMSRRINMLEQLLGTSLIVRTTRTVHLTPAGQALRPHAQAILRAADAAADAATRAAAVPGLDLAGIQNEQLPGPTAPSSTVPWVRSMRNAQPADA